MSNFSKFKQSQQKDSLTQLSALAEKFKGPTSNQSRGDERLWKPVADQHGNGSAIIRFLPSPAVDGDDGIPLTRYYGHAFKSKKNRWYIEKCRSTINLPDPVMDLNGDLWKITGDKKCPYKDQAREQKRHQHYVANIYVVKHTNKPDDEGKVFLYDFGPGIFNFIEEARNPRIDDLTGQPLRPAFDPFNFWTGANFFMRFHVENKQRTYKNSSWGQCDALFPNDIDLEKIHNAEFSLKEFTDPATFKSYEELKKRLDTVLGVNEVKTPEEPRQVAEPSPRREVSSTTSFMSDDPDDDDFKALIDPDDDIPF